MSQGADSKWNVTLAFSLVLIVAAAYLGFFMKKPDESTSKQAHQDLRGLIAKTTTVHKQIEATHKQLHARVWNVSVESLGSITLENLNRLVGIEHLQLLGFLVGRTSPLGKMLETPFSIRVEGGFMDVMGLVAKLEDPATRLAVDMVHITAKNGASDDVEAEIGLIGFIGEREAK